MIAYKMSEDEFYVLWVAQNRKKIHEYRKKMFKDVTQAVVLDGVFYDLAAALYEHHPEVVGNNN